MLGMPAFSLRGGHVFLCAEQQQTPYRLCALRAGGRSADALASYLAANEAQGLLYHRDTVHFTGDYDISEDEAEILRLLREGSKP